MLYPVIASSVPAYCRRMSYSLYSSVLNLVATLSVKLEPRTFFFSVVSSSTVSSSAAVRGGGVIALDFLLVRQLGIRNAVENLGVFIGFGVGVGVGIGIDVSVGVGAMWA